MPKSKKPRNPPVGNPRKKWDAAVVAAVIAGGATVLASIVGGVLLWLSNSAGSSTGPQEKNVSPTAGFISAQASFEQAVAELENPEPSTEDKGVVDLGIVYHIADSELQQRIIDILVQWIPNHAPPMPSAGNTFGYCLMNPAIRYPAGVSDALRIIGSRDSSQVGRRVNLSNINFAYATLDGLNFQNVNLDNDLLCRTIFYESNFQGASFEGADLRFTIIRNSKGLTVDQLIATYSLYKATLPSRLANNKSIRALVRRDPQLAPGYGL